MNEDKIDCCCCGKLASAEGAEPMDDSPFMVCRQCVDDIKAGFFDAEDDADDE